MEEPDISKKKLSDFAGSWADMGDEEAKEFLDRVYKERRVVSRRIE